MFLSKAAFKVYGLLAIAGGLWWGLMYIKGVFKKANEYDKLTIENASLTSERSILNDSLILYKESLAKAYLDAKNKSEIYTLNSSLLPSAQSVIKVMRDSVIKINKDRATLEAKNLELEKDLERAKKKRRFL